MSYLIIILYKGSKERFVELIDIVLIEQLK